ncbi:MAG TPA: heparan-alpha-glucosaminide N-acetyltransferase domain-containing protein [Holophaga sp.]|nr:heparan-alpha-glucosaminide N-acetyltransferase domain-containing protein [Holophaga sp.]
MTPASEPAAPRRGRLDFLDFIRLAAMAFMVQGHTLDALVRPQHLDLGTFPWNVWHALRGQTAPIFLMVSGLVGVLSLRRDEDGRVPAAKLGHRLAWAFGLMALGYLLVFPANRIADLRWLSPEGWRGFLQVNILQLNGAGLLILTALASLTRSDRAYGRIALGLAAATLVATPLIQALDWFRILPEGLAAYVSHAHGSLFPLFPHGMYLFLGAAAGWHLKGIPPEEASRRFRRLCGWGTLAALAGSGLAALLPPGLLPPHDLYTTSWTFTLLRLGLALPMMALLSLWAERRPTFTAACAPLGKHSLKVYVGHLVLLYGLPWTLGLTGKVYRSLGLGSGLLAVLLVGGITFGGVILLERIQRQAAPLWLALRLSSAGLVAWALIF